MLVLRQTLLNDDVYSNIVGNDLTVLKYTADELKDCLAIAFDMKRSQTGAHV